jgi:hypothetical protein
MFDINKLYDSREYSLWVTFKSAKKERLDGRYLVETYDVNMKPDCKVGNIGKNFFFRTEKGQNYERYDSLKEMLKAIKKRAKEYDLEASRFTLKSNRLERDNGQSDEYINAIVEDGNLNEFISI